MAFSAWQSLEKNQVSKIFGGVIKIMVPDFKGPIMKVHNFADPQPLLAQLAAVGLEDINCRYMPFPAAFELYRVHVGMSMPSGSEDGKSQCSVDIYVGLAMSLIDCQTGSSKSLCNACREVCVPMLMPENYIPMAIKANAPLAAVMEKFTDQSEATKQRAVKAAQKIAADNGCLREDGALDMPHNYMHYVTARKPLQ